ncbi:lysoplasmalogenase [Acidimangrovimonas sediminis]|uniref:lysoplasmalogenase n=1 Tax=Acidimangrovimonas sediminis TaxID=2056283 RepID=UPI000C80F3BB|nr:lysoplasmalogenase [Acidimangrovimonas sediminis]
MHDQTLAGNLVTALLSLGVGFAAVYLLQWCTRPVSWPRSGVKTLATLCLAGAAATLGAPLLVTLGLALGAAGDFALSRPGRRAFLAGMALFALGHLAYAAAFLRAGLGDILLLPAVAVAALALSTEIWLRPRTGALKWPVRGYVVAITAMMLAALTLPDRALAVILGAALFLGSDLLLSTVLFPRPGASRAPSTRLSRLASRMAWVGYWAGQALIALGAAAALGMRP